MLKDRKKLIIIGCVAIVAIITTVLCICLLGKGNNNTSNQSNSFNQSEEKQTDNGTIDLESDDTKFVVTTGATSTVYYYEGENVTGISLYIDMDDAETAQMVYISTKASYEVQDNVKGVSVKGKYLVVDYDIKFAEETAGSTNINEIKKTYGMYKEIIDAGDDEGRQSVIDKYINKNTKADGLAGELGIDYSAVGYDYKNAYSSKNNVVFELNSALKNNKEGFEIMLNYLKNLTDDGKLYSKYIEGEEFDLTGHSDNMAAVYFIANINNKKYSVTGTASNTRIFTYTFEEM